MTVGKAILNVSQMYKTLALTLKIQKTEIGGNKTEMGNFRISGIYPPYGFVQINTLIFSKIVCFLWDIYIADQILKTYTMVKKIGIPKCVNMYNKTA